MGILISWLVFAVAIYATAYLLPGVELSGFMGALWVALGLGVINALIRPVLLILTLPLNILTLGLLTFVINALMVMLADYLLVDFGVANFWWALLFSLVVSVINAILSSIIGGAKK